MMVYWLMDSRAVRLIQRFLPLFTACWMLVDMCLDAYQTMTYYHLNGFGGKGIYHDWALAHQNSSNTTYLQSVSSAYFYCACVVWVVPPLLCLDVEDRESNSGPFLLPVVPFAVGGNIQGV